jgi:hypothetical protein
MVDKEKELENCEECQICKLNNPKHPICDYHKGIQKGSQIERDEIKKKIKKIKKEWAKINKCKEKITHKKGKCSYCDGLRLFKELLNSLGEK